jgi:soluble lytic murein transglycosylase-like protein
MRILPRIAVFLMTSLLTVVAVAAFPYQSIAQEAAARYGLPVEFITAVMKQESNFNPSAVSLVGAQGLMQLMPGTARELGVTDSFDPRQNIFGGANYLRQQLNRFNGNFALAAAAYNAGPGGLQSAIDRAVRVSKLSDGFPPVFDQIM